MEQPGRAAWSGRGRLPPMPRLAIVPRMIVWRGKDVPRRLLPGGETRAYYLADTFEVIVTDVPAGHAEPAHRHEHILETYFVLEGEIEFTQGEERLVLAAGDAVVVEPSALCHTVANRGSRPARTLTLKLPNLATFRALFRSDKKADSGA